MVVRALADALADRAAAETPVDLAYLVAGGVISATHNYWNNLDSVKAVVSALLATVAWPLILLDVNLHIH